MPSCSLRPRKRARARRLRQRRTAAPPDPDVGGAGAGPLGAPRLGRGPGGERGTHRLSWGRRRRQALASAGGALPALRQLTCSQNLGSWQLWWLRGRLPHGPPRPARGASAHGLRRLRWRDGLSAALRCPLREYALGPLWRELEPGARPAPAFLAGRRIGELLRSEGAGDGVPGGQAGPHCSAERRDVVFERYCYVLFLFWGSSLPSVQRDVLKSGRNLCLPNCRFWFKSV